VLGANVTAGVPAVGERLAETTAVLAARGVEAASASRAAVSLLDKVVIGQSTVIAFDTAFNSVAVLFVFAAPMLVAIKIGLHRFQRVHVGQ
jgi:MFS transporter, DHA2 family, multidrug resistance protein